MFLVPSFLSCPYSALSSIFTDFVSCSACHLALSSFFVWNEIKCKSKMCSVLRTCNNRSTWNNHSFNISNMKAENEKRWLVPPHTHTHTVPTLIYLLKMLNCQQITSWLDVLQFHGTRCHRTVTHLNSFQFGSISIVHSILFYNYEYIYPTAGFPPSRSISCSSYTITLFVVFCPVVVGHLSHFLTFCFTN